MIAYRNARDARRSGEQGFTLIEVMVVVLIIGILLAIGIPTFLGARSRAQDRAAQSNLRTAQNTAMVLFSDSGDFSAAGVVRSQEAEPGLQWGTDASSADDVISVWSAPDRTEFGIAAMSDSGTCFTVRLRSGGPALYGQTTSDCTGRNALSTSTTSW